jgi:hypothetical protein
MSQGDIMPLPIINLGAGVSEPVRRTIIVEVAAEPAVIVDIGKDAAFAHQGGHIGIGGIDPELVAGGRAVRLSYLQSVASDFDISAGPVEERTVISMKEKHFIIKMDIEISI